MKDLVDALSALVNLAEGRKRELGVEYTAAEIAHQPETWLDTLALVRRRKLELERFLKSVAGWPVLLTGAGTSDFAGRAVERLLERRWRTTVRAVASTDLLTGMEDWLRQEAPSLCISISRSGDSSEGVAAIEEMTRQFPRVAHQVITCNAEGAMAKLTRERPGSYALVLDPATNDRGLAMTSSYTNMVLAAQALGYLDDLDSFGAAVEAMAKSATSLRPGAADAAAKLAKSGFRRVCFLGSGALAATATESALKVQELTAGRIFTMSQSFLGLRHGPLSFLDKETVVVAYLASNAQTRSYETDLLGELRDKKLGATIVATGFGLSREEKAKIDVAVDLGPERTAIPDELRPPLDVIVGQLLGLFCSLEHGLKPDTPSPTGAISRVVSHVRIHSSADAQPVAETQWP